ncbi:MAG: DNA polymerase I [Sphingomonadales bacterium]
MVNNKSEKGHIYLIDGSGFIFRAYHALPPMTSPDGTPVNAVYGFSNMLLKLIQDMDDVDKPTHAAVILDRSRKTFRNDIYPKYKAHRPPAPEDLVPQFPIIREATEAFNVHCIDMEGFEADDIIATYARNAQEEGFKVTIVSSDKDLMQLVGDGIVMFDSMKNRTIGVEEVKEKFGLGPEKVIEIQALAGDSADNVPGVPGIGVKTAALLLEEFGDLESLLRRAGEIKQNKRRENLIEFADLARVSKELVTLKTDIEGLLPFKSLVVNAINSEKILPFVEKYGLQSLKRKVLFHIGSGEAEDQIVKEIKTTDLSYETIDEVAGLEDWITKIYKEGFVAVDTETTGLNPVDAKLVGISLSTESGKACYIPLRHKGENEGGLNFGGNDIKQISLATALSLLKPVLEDPSILKIGQNIKYDMSIFAGENIYLNPIDDTMLMSYALEAGLHGHGMDELSQLHFGFKPTSFKEVAGVGKSQITFDYVAIDKATHYAAEDADITGRLWRILKPQLREEGLSTVYETLERPLAPVLSRMEQRGIKVDREELSRLSFDFAGRMAKQELKIHSLAGHPFNIASPKQLGEVLFDEMGLKGGKKGKNGDYSTNAEALEKLAIEGAEIAKVALDWRQLQKLKSTYTDSLQREISKKTGRVHTSFAMASTTTGRLSSTNPNLQNIPIRTEEGRKIRKAFIPEIGKKLIAADYSQIELRLLAHIAELDTLRTAFEEGQDIHAMTASEVFGVPIKGMDPIVRRQAKAINFGIIYGISAFGLANQLGVSRTEASDYIKAYFEKFPGIKAYMEDTKEFAHKYGYVETIYGRRCHVSSINDKNPMRRAFGERAAINAPIQGSAADIIRRAMVRMEGSLEEKGLGHIKMLLQVHDELIFEAPEKDVSAAIGVIRKTMEEASLPTIKLNVPIIVDCGVGDNWDEAH